MSIRDAKRNLSVTFYKNEKSTNPHNAGLATLELLSKILAKRDIRPDKSGPAFALYKLKERGSRRNLDVISRSGIECDIDNGATLNNLRTAIDCYMWTAYSTHSHNPENDKFKFRLVIPFSRDVNPDEWPYVWYGCNELLGKVLDPSTKDISRLVYLPSCPKENEQHAFDEHHDGELIDPDMLITLAQKAKIGRNPSAINNLLTVKTPPPPETHEEITRVQSMLQAISSNCNREKWRNIGWAVCSLNWNSGFNLFDEWSASCPTLYDKAETIKVWSSFHSDRGISFGTLVHHAKQAGWKDKLQLSTDSETPGDIANGQLFAKIHNGKFLYAYPVGKWLRWDDSRWLWCEIGEALQAGKTAAGKILESAAKRYQENQDDRGKRLVASAMQTQNLNKIEAMIKMAASEPGMGIGSMEELDRDPWLLGCRNGVVDLRTGNLLSPDPKMLITRQCHATYDRDAKCSKWKDFLLEVFKGDSDMVGYTQRALGYTLTGHIAEEVLFFAHGYGCNGKSVFANVLIGIMGDYAVTAPASMLTARKDADKPRNDVARLCGARLVLANETQSGDRFDEQLIKTLVSRERITARFLHREYFEFQPTFKLWIRGNHKPIITGDDLGIWRRVQLLPFVRSFTETEIDPGLEEKLLTERDGILCWMIDGALSWKCNGLKPAKVVQQASNAYRKECDVLGEWIDTECEIKVGVKIKQQTLYENYRTWCFQGGMHPMTKKSFTRKLAERGIQTDRIYINKNRAYGGIIPLIG